MSRLLLTLLASALLLAACTLPPRTAVPVVSPEPPAIHLTVPTLPPWPPGTLPPPEAIPDPLRNPSLDLPLELPPAVSRPRFQVFILTPLTTCLAGNEFASGNVCAGTACGDCSCTWEEHDPPAPQTGVAPARHDDPRNAS